MGGIQSESTLPGDPTFSHTNNNYDTSSFKRMHAEFGISPSAEEGDNHGLATVFICVIFWSGSRWFNDLPWKKQFSDEGGKAIKGVLLFSRTLLLSIFCYLFSIIFLCMCHSCKFFTVNFIYSDLSFDCLNRLTVYTVSINRFTSL